MFGDTDIGVALEHLQGRRKDLARLDGTSAEEQDLVLKKMEVGGTILRAKEARLKTNTLRGASDLRNRLKNMHVIMRASYPGNRQAREEVEKLMNAVEMCTQIEESIPIEVVQFCGDEVNACLQDWSELVIVTAAKAREKLARRAAKSRHNYSMESRIHDVELGCPRLSFKNILKYFTDGAALSNLIRLLGCEETDLEKISRGVMLEVGKEEVKSMRKPGGAASSTIKRKLKKASLGLALDSEKPYANLT